MTMQSKMSKSERVQAALNLQETDRTPIYDILMNDATIEYLTGRFPPVGEEGLKLRLQASARVLDMTRMATHAPEEPSETASPDGFIFHKSDRWTSGGIKSRPFHDEKGAEEWLGKALQGMREKRDPKRHAEFFRAVHEKSRSYLGDDTVIVYEFMTGLDILRYMLGLELFSYVWADAPGMISEYLELTTASEVERIHAIADASIFPCALPAGDIAFKGKLIHSPAWLRGEFLPRLKQLNDALHEHGIKCLFHSDGYLMDIMPDLIDAGIDGLNPIETAAGMDLREVKEKYGNRLFLTGGIDVSQLMSNGSPEEVRQTCREAIDIASPGYFIGSTTEIDNGSKLENILTMVEVAWGKPVEPFR